MLTPEQIAALRDAAAQIADPINEFLLSDIARRISEAGQLTSTAAYQIWQAQNLGKSQRQIKKELKRILGVSNRELRQLLTQSAEVGYDFDIKKLSQVQAIPFHRNSVMQQIVRSAVQLAQEDFTNLTQTIGMIDPHGKALPLQDAYRSCTDYAFKQVFTGATDYNTAIRQATRNLAKYGLRTIDYESGVHTSIEAAIRRNIMGGMGLMQEQISQHNFEVLGADGWELSAHGNSAPDHEPIQGKQFPAAEYQAMNNELLRRIGTLNCGHAAFPIILGITKPQYTAEQLEALKTANAKGVTVDGKHYTGYQATQMQRKLERTIRAQKRRVLLAEGNPNDPDRLLTAQTRLTRLNQEYRRFSTAAGLRTQNERAQVAGFGRGQAARASAAARKEIDKYREIRYNKNGTVQVTDDWTQKKHPHLNPTYKPNAVVDTASRGGKQRDRTVYDSDGRMLKQIHGGNHGHPKQHLYGSHGEHSHDYVWPDGADRPARITREATEAERTQHADILGGEDDDG